MTWSLSMRGERDELAKRVEEADIQGHGDFDAELAQIKRAKATIVEEIRSYAPGACASVSAFGYVSRDGAGRNLQINVSPSVAGKV